MENGAYPLDTGRNLRRPPLRRDGHPCVQSANYRPAAITPLARRMRSAARSAMTTHGAIVLPRVIRGMIEASAMRSLSIPYTRSWWSTTDIASRPIFAVPHWCQ